MLGLDALEVREVRGQLEDLMDQQRVPVTSCGEGAWDAVRRAICSAYFFNAAKLRGVGEYVNLLSAIPCHLHPSSALFNKNPEWLIYHELVLTTKEYMRSVIPIQPSWLLEIAPHYYQDVDLQVKDGQRAKANTKNLEIPGRSVAK